MRTRFAWFSACILLFGVNAYYAFFLWYDWDSEVFGLFEWYADGYGWPATLRLIAEIWWDMVCEHGLDGSGWMVISHFTLTFAGYWFCAFKAMQHRNRDATRLPQ
jgi:hypothetical protein